MARRARKSGVTPWWAALMLVAGVALLVWWLGARRAETPGLPASQPGARALSAEPPGTADHAHDEVTGDEKAALDRIIRERGAATPGG